MERRIFQNDWHDELREEMQKPYFLELRQFLKEEYKTHTIYPHQHDIFNALHYTPFEQVKVVILGQDPYHGPNQAHGLSFSVQEGIELPPSLRNIFQELQNDLGCYIPNNGYLKKWADQGVLLLNTVLTVRHGAAHSHQGMGWETFTDCIISKLNDRKKPVIFILWGNPAKRKLQLINQRKHFIITSAHPSPLSAYRGFLGSKPFSQVNRYLREMNEQEISWQIENVEEG